MLLKAVMKIYLNKCLKTLITIKNHAINSFHGYYCMKKNVSQKAASKKNNEKRDTLLFRYPTHHENISEYNFRQINFHILGF